MQTIADLKGKRMTAGYTAQKNHQSAKRRHVCHGRYD